MIQSLMFNRRTWSPGMIIDWCDANGYGHSKMRLTRNFIRVRQMPPIPGASYHTIKLGHDIEAVIMN
jgi:hypothetical protein